MAKGGKREKKKKKKTDTHIAQEEARRLHDARVLHVGVDNAHYCIHAAEAQELHRVPLLLQQVPQGIFFLGGGKGGEGVGETKIGRE